MNLYSAEYNIKEITGISRLSDEDPTKIIYLKIKVFVPLNKEIETQIKEFENGQMNATFIKPMANLDFDMMAPQTVKNVDGESVLDFHME
ncbi:unnamed protein product [Rhizophagus irregularis]|uniref:Uncharacterized protein n=1 Tax=Rhizophagus irregularis TaxID=588596 RepID=A0A915Z223_9GLOM|nr:unnamed protein product [Rhizophagus irregularis]CAB5357621.1 unnamed protein product [Rhizophagus irregularis]